MGRKVHHPVGAEAIRIKGPNKRSLRIRGVQLFHRGLAAVGEDISGGDDPKGAVLLVELDQGRFQDPISAVIIDDHQGAASAGEETLRYVFQQAPDRHGAESQRPPETNVPPGGHDRQGRQEISGKLLGQTAPPFQGLEVVGRQGQGRGVLFDGRGGQNGQLQPGWGERTAGRSPVRAALFDAGYFPLGHHVSFSRCSSMGLSPGKSPKA